MKKVGWLLLGLVLVASCNGLLATFYTDGDPVAPTTSVAEGCEPPLEDNCEGTRHTGWFAEYEGLELIGWNFKNSYFDYAKFSRANLTNAIFVHSRFTNVRFGEAILKNASFENAKLNGVFFGAADLQGANFSASKGVFLRFTATIKVNGANLDYADFTGATLTESMLNLCSARYANFSAAVLDKTSFLEADLSYSSFFAASLQQSDFSLSKLVGANLENSDLSGASLWGADLTDANLIGADLTGADLTGADFSGATMPDGTIHD
jgi:uncharacterized protein YjbI with pentapeptide repeats